VDHHAPDRLACTVLKPRRVRRLHLSEPAFRLTWLPGERWARRVTLASALALCLPSGAAAEPVPLPEAPKPTRPVDPDAYRVVVDRFEGKNGALVRAGVVEALEAEDNVDLVSIRLLDEQSELIDGSADGYAAAGKRLNVIAIVRAKIRKKDDRQRITFTVIRSRDGTAAGKLAYEAEKPEELRDKVKAELWRELEPLLAAERKPSAAAARADADDTAQQLRDKRKAELEARPTPPAEEVDLEEKADTPPPELDSPGRGSGCPWLELEAAGGILRRTFDYTNEQSGALRGFRMPGEPMARLDATFFPWALSRCRFSSGLGISAGFETASGAQAQLAGRSLTHVTFGTRGELLLRIPLGTAWLTPRLGYAGRRFLVQGDFVPDIDAHAVGGGLDFGLRAGIFVGELGGSMRAALAAGQIRGDEWFPDSSALGYDAGLQLGLGVTRWLDVLVGGRFEYWVYQLDTTTGNPSANGVADSATDAYLRGELGLRFNVPSHAGAR